MPTPQNSSPQQRLKVVQIVVGAFLLGIITFAGVTVMLSLTGQPAGNPSFPLGIGMIVWGVAFVLTTGLSIIMRTLVASQVRRKIETGDTGAGEEQALLARFSQLTIVRATLHEGPALLGLAMSFLTGHWIGLVAAGAGVLLLGSVFPTRGRFEAFVRDSTGRMPG